MEGAMLVKISSQISPNSTRFGVNMELSAKDTRFGNDLGGGNVINNSPRSAILKNDDTSKESVSLRSKLVGEEESLKNTVETFSVTMREEKVL